VKRLLVAAAAILALALASCGWGGRDFKGCEGRSGVYEVHKYDGYTQIVVVPDDPKCKG